MINNHIRSTLFDLLSLASSREVKLFVVGGTLRDHLLNKTISDIDLTAKSAADLGIEFARSLNLTHVQLDKTPGRATTRIILPHNKHFDLTDIQGTTIEEDLSKRDFTINAMGQELSNFLSNGKNIIDPHNGKKDLKNALIKATTPTVFQTDPVRMLRAFRLAATINFSIAKETLKEISLYNKNISASASERIWHELLIFLYRENTGDLVSGMQKSGLLCIILPINFSNWDDLLSNYNRLEHILSKPKLYFSRQLSKIRLKEKALIKLSLLLKNTDKNLTLENKRKKDFGTPNSFKILKNLKVGNSEISFICKSIQCSHFLSKSLSSNIKNSFLYDLCVMGGSELVAGALLQASTLSYNESSECIEIKLFNSFSKLLNFYFEQYYPIAGKKPLLSGKDVIKKFNISPSPLLGNLLNNIQRAQVLGEIKTKREAEMLAGRILKSIKKPYGYDNKISK